MPRFLAARAMSWHAPAGHGPPDYAPGSRAPSSGQPIEVGTMRTKQQVPDPQEALQQKQRREELALRHHGWLVWVAGTMPVATRSGSPKPPENAEVTGWARTLLGDGS